MIMKTFITILILALNSIYTNAQQQNDKTDIGELLEQAKTNFKSITGAKKLEKDGLILYACTHPSIFGEFGDIFKDTKTGTTNYSMFVNYNSATENFKKALDEYLEAKFPEPDYYIFRDIDDNFEEVTVMSDIKDPKKPKKTYLIYTVDIDPTNNQKTFELVIYGLS